MKTIIAGSRGITDYNIVEQAVIESGFDITCVVSGMARGVDTLGEQWAIKNGINIQHFPADWNKFKKSAGYIRNADMAKIAEALIVIILNDSRGSLHMLELAQKKNIPIYCKRIYS